MRFRNWRWSSGVAEATTSRLANTPPSLSWPATSLNRSRFRWSSRWWMENPSDNDIERSKRRQRIIQGPLPNVYPMVPVESISGIPEHGRGGVHSYDAVDARSMFEYEAASLPSPQPRSSTERGESGSTEPAPPRRQPVEPIHRSGSDSGPLGQGHSTWPPQDTRVLVRWSPPDPYR